MGVASIRAALCAALALSGAVSGAVPGAVSNAAAAQAGGQSGAAALCINPRNSYEARIVDAHTAIVRNTLGGVAPWVRVRTSCVGLSDDDRMSLAQTFSCLGRGDQIAAVSANGRVQRCTVTGLAPYDSDTEESGDRESEN